MRTITVPFPNFEILSDFADMCGDGRWYGDLALYFAECATDFTMSYGDINESYISV